jgi:hypothetical protein
VKESVSSGAQSLAGSAMNAKTALLAGGAAAAGLAATVLVNRQQNSRTKVLGVTVPKPKSSISSKALRTGLPTRGIKRDTRRLAAKVGKAADRAERLGKGVTKVASSVKQVSDTAGEAAKK